MSGRERERGGRAREKDGMDRAHPDPRTTFFSTPGAKSDKSNLTDGIAAIQRRKGVNCACGDRRADGKEIIERERGRETLFWFYRALVKIYNLENACPISC